MSSLQSASVGSLLQQTSPQVETQQPLSWFGWPFSEPFHLKIIAIDSAKQAVAILFRWEDSGGHFGLHLKVSGEPLERESFRPVLSLDKVPFSPYQYGFL